MANRLVIFWYGYCTIRKALHSIFLSTLMFNHGRHFGFYLEPHSALIWSSNLAIAPSVVAHLSTRKGLWRRGVKSLTSIICTRAVSNRLRAKMTISAGQIMRYESSFWKKTHFFAFRTFSFNHKKRECVPVNIRALCEKEENFNKLNLFRSTKMRKHM